MDLLNTAIGIETFSDPLFLKCHFFVSKFLLSTFVSTHESFHICDDELLTTKGLFGGALFRKTRNLVLESDLGRCQLLSLRASATCFLLKMMTLELPRILILT